MRECLVVVQAFQPVDHGLDRGERNEVAKSDVDILQVRSSQRRKGAFMWLSGTAQARVIEAPPKRPARWRPEPVRRRRLSL